MLLWLSTVVLTVKCHTTAPPEDVIQVEKFLKGSGNLGTSQIAADDPKINAVCRIKCRE